MATKSRTQNAIARRNGVAPETLEALPSHLHRRVPHRKPPRGVEIIDGGTVTSPQGFVAGATYAGIKTLGSAPLDLGILASDREARVAAMFTRSTVKGAAVLVSKAHARNGSARGVIVNSGISNVGTGAQGMGDAREMCVLAAEISGCAAGEMLVGSTGVIGRTLPIEKIRNATPRIKLTRDGGAAFARAIMTTDTRPKTMAVRFKVAGREYRIRGRREGVGDDPPRYGDDVLLLYNGRIS